MLQSKAVLLFSLIPIVVEKVLQIIKTNNEILLSYLKLIYFYRRYHIKTFLSKYC